MHGAYMVNRRRGAWCMVHDACMVNRRRGAWCMEMMAGCMVNEWIKNDA